MHPHISGHGSHVEGFEMAETLIEDVTLVAEDLRGNLVNGLLAQAEFLNFKSIDGALNGSHRSIQKHLDDPLLGDRSLGGGPIGREC
jgi:hypothetical protein